MTNAQIFTDFLVGKDELSVKIDDIMKQSERVGNLQARGFLSNKEGAAEIAKLKELYPQVGNGIVDSMKRGEAAAGKFDMRMLSVMFTGMAMQRAFGGLLTSIKDTFFAAEGDTSALTESTTQLSAAWEFFKFSLFDALNTPFFTNIIDGITSTIDKWSQMSDTAKQAIVFIVGGLAAIGTSLFLLGQMRLGWDAMFDSSGVFGKIGKIIGSSGAGGIVGIGAALITVSLLIVAANTDWEDFSEAGQDSVTAVKNSFEPLTDALDDVANKLGMEDRWDLFGEAGTGALKIIGTLAKATTDALLNMMDPITDFINLSLSVQEHGLMKGIVAFMEDADKEVTATLQDYSNIWTDSNKDIAQSTADLTTNALDPLNERTKVTNELVEEQVNKLFPQVIESNNNQTEAINNKVEAMDAEKSKLRDLIDLYDDLADAKSNAGELDFGKFIADDSSVTAGD